MSQTPPELFSQAPIRSDFASYHRMEGRHPRRLRLIAVVVALVFCGGLIAWAISGSSEPKEIPTIKAADGPSKQRPDQPGGIDIPHQDMLVFQQIENNDGSKSTVEHLLPVPETPQAQTLTTASIEATASAQPLVSPSTAANATGNAVPPVVTDTPVIAPPSVPTASPVPPAPSAAPTQTVTQAVVPTAAPAPIVATASPKAPVVEAAAPALPKQETAGKLPKELFMIDAKKTTLIQLASVPNEVEAQSMLKTMQSKYAGAMGHSKLRLVKAAIPGKGTYYRIQSEPLSDATAKSICSALTKQKASCIVVHP